MKNLLIHFLEAIIASSLLLSCGQVMKRIVLLLTLLAVLSSCQKQYRFKGESSKAVLTKSQSEVLTGIGNVSFDIGGRIFQEKGSFVFSPASMAVVSGLLSAAADEQSQVELCEKFGFEDGRQESFNEFCASLLSLLRGDSSVKLLFSDALFYNSSINLSDTYYRLAKEFYDAECISGNSIQQSVNTWLRNVSEDGNYSPVVGLPEDTQIALMSYMGFKAEWKTPFPKQGIFESVFQSNEGKARDILMMHSLQTLPYLEDDSFTFIQVPYAGNDYYASFILPAKDKSIKDVFDIISEIGWASIESRASNVLVYMDLPIFSVESETDFIPILKGIGINHVFSSGADFSKISADNIKYELKDIRQNSTISFSEKGTEGTSLSRAALTLVEDPLTESEQKYSYFIANRPFLFVIGQKSTGALLYIGAYC